MSLLVALALLPSLLGISAHALAFGDGRLVIAETVAPGSDRQLHGDDGLVLAQSEVVLRIPIRPKAAHAVDWDERKGPKCVATDHIRGAILTEAGQVDFLMERDHRVRAELSEDCPAIDYYTGFYITPEDDRICARRDRISTRMGGSCRIERFRELVRRPRH